jgi:hypothetical protein
MSLEEYLERENKHLFGDGFQEVKDDDAFWLYETYQPVQSSSKTPFIDNIYQSEVHPLLKNDLCSPSYYEQRPRIQGYKVPDITIESYQNNVEKSWLFNLETQESSLIIDDIDNGEIPEMLVDYEWVEYLEIDSQKIKKIKNLPKNLKRLSLFNNSIEEIHSGDLPESLEDINLSRNKITILQNIPKKVKELDLSHNLIVGCNLTENEELLELNIENNLFERIPYLPINLKKLDISQNKLISLEGIIDSIEELDISMNKIENISHLPSNLRKLNAFDNKIKIIHKFQDNLEHIDLSFNKLYWIPKIPSKLQKGDFSNNNIALIAVFTNNELDYKNGNLPEGNYTINISNNPLNNLPEHIFNDIRVTHNKISSVKIKEDIPVLSNNYIEIKLTKTIVV